MNWVRWIFFCCGQSIHIAVHNFSPSMASWLHDLRVWSDRSVCRSVGRTVVAVRASILAWTGRDFRMSNEDPSFFSPHLLSALIKGSGCLHNGWSSKEPHHTQCLAAPLISLRQGGGPGGGGRGSYGAFFLLKPMRQQRGLKNELVEGRQINQNNLEDWNWTWRKNGDKFGHTPLPFLAFIPIQQPEPEPHLQPAQMIVVALEQGLQMTLIRFFNFCCCCWGESHFEIEIDRAKEILLVSKC